ncbi:CinA family nicotinamide mononucleotide deamidase-related protein [Flavobacterium sp.]|jgi:nicotinamide-nucleotide amidase|uniref:CinA family nicotinamide mononucleotide deamidase-related protein n=1 Tax=Flavobacterium sp. TaxID=239 RepID=UPI0022BF466C|nr:CinA family nicotinamide mononucleotide deamidase-related protein [Flavobacterium sp.]MCZ8228391.1 CinA family nicotinamide mononucleotide deamidase-related protein [Flavobacterium sp.]
MKAAIITIGDEILIGQIVDTNSAYIAKALDRIGIEVVEMLSISDDKQAILDTFALMQDTVDVVVITGGLGPTKDDITKKTICDYFDDTLIRNVEVEAHVIALIEKALQREASQMNKDQALVPSKCVILHNEVGTAPGMWIKKGQTVFVSLPGVPYEMKYLVDYQLVPKLVVEYERPFIIHKTVLTYGQGESLVAERIEDWENDLPSFIKLAYLPAPGRVRLRLTAKGKDKQVLETELERRLATLSTLIGDIIVGFDEEETLEFVVGKQLTLKNKTLATAESCTGGKIAQSIAGVPGASNYFKGSVVAYATEMKTKLLEVSLSTIEAHSVVSAEVAKEMAINCQKIFETDYAIATTGNAGPSKGDSDASVGSVFIGLATPNGVIVEGFNFGQPREKVIDRAVTKSLEMLQKEILKNVL